MVIRDGALGLSFLTTDWARRAAFAFTMCIVETDSDAAAMHTRHAKPRSERKTKFMLLKLARCRLS